MPCLTQDGGTGGPAATEHAKHGRAGVFWPPLPAALYEPLFVPCPLQCCRSGVDMSVDQPVLGGCVFGGGGSSH